MNHIESVIRNQAVQRLENQKQTFFRIDLIPLKKFVGRNDYNNRERMKMLMKYIDYLIRNCEVKKNE